MCSVGWHTDFCAWQSSLSLYISVSIDFYCLTREVLCHGLNMYLCVWPPTGGADVDGLAQPAVRCLQRDQIMQTR